MSRKLKGHVRNYILEVFRNLGNLKMVKKLSSTLWTSIQVCICFLGSLHILVVALYDHIEYHNDRVLCKVFLGVKGALSGLR